MERKHISEQERKRWKLISILIGILILIIIIIILMFIPKGKKEPQTQNTETQSSSSSISGQQTSTAPSKYDNKVNNKNNTSKPSNSVNGSDIIVKDKTKVNIKIKPGTLTVDGAVIVITDTNINPYSWTPIYRLQKKVDGEWKDMELLNPENAFFAEIEYDNATGVMEQSLVWSNKYGKLVSGNYRIVKESGGNEFYAVFEVQ